MYSNKDALGQEILSYYLGKRTCEIIERDDGFFDCSSGAKSYFAEFKDWPDIQKKAMKFAKGKILDIGAGAGRVTLYLQKKGLKAMAVDNSPLAIEVCKKRGIKQARVLPIEKIGSFKANSFDTILMLGNNFGLFGSYNKAKSLLKKMYKITSSRALIIAESNDVHNTDDSAHLAYQKLNLKRGRMPGQLRIRVRFKKYVGDWFDYLFVSKNELENILKNTGWRVRKFINSNGSMYTAIIEKEK